MSRLEVLFDVRQPKAYLALAPTREMAADLGAEIDWQPLLVAPPAPIPPPSEQPDRGEQHRWHRATYQLEDHQRYARARGLPDGVFDAARVYRQQAAEPAAAAFGWLKAEHPDAVDACLDALFEGYWLDDLRLDAVEDAVALLAGLGFDPRGFAVDNARAALEALDTQQAALREAGYFDVPGYLVNDEVYYGRQHLPMIRWILEGRPGQAPA